ncbi:hypothetical protein ACFWQD_06490 [Alcaligenes faecalis]|uniref:hypothetical protein n=1 Tax=Alcaligenes faecalis TaxID=511 RepID=UPI00365AAA3D
MKKKIYDGEALLLLALLVGVGVGTGVGMFFFPFLRPLLAFDGAAAWVQAFGSVTAVAVAIYVSNRQSRIERESRALIAESAKKLATDSGIAELEAAAQLVERLGRDVKKVCKGTIKKLKDGDITNYRRSRYLRNSQAAVSRIPLHQMPYAVIARHTIDIVHYSNVCAELLLSLSPHNDRFGADILASPQTPLERLQVLLAKTDESLGYLDDAVRQFDGESPAISARHL